VRGVARYAPRRVAARTYRRDELPVWFGKYRLLERLGFGGMAEVFRAELPGEAGFVKPAVIKRILPHLAGSDEMVELFLAEARLLARAQHPSVVQVFELGRAETGEFYLAMELVDGCDLLGLLRAISDVGLRVPPEASAYVVAQVLAGLAYVHGLTDPRGVPLGVVHRDVSPSNVFVSRQGDVKLGDFGVAKSTDVRHVTAVGMVKGKLEYAAPEQILRGRLDGRTDVFGAGVLLWELLAQRRLFGAEDDREIRKQVLEAERPPPSTYRGDVPIALEHVVMRALAVDPTQRYATAKEFQRALTRAAHGLGRPFAADDLAALVRTAVDGSGEASLIPLFDREGGVQLGFDDHQPALLSRAVYWVSPEPELELVEIEADVIEEHAALPIERRSTSPVGALGEGGLGFAGLQELPSLGDGALDPLPAPSPMPTLEPGQVRALAEDVWVELSHAPVRPLSDDEAPMPTLGLADDLFLDEPLAPAPAQPEALMVRVEGLPERVPVAAWIASAASGGAPRVSIDGQVWRASVGLLGLTPAPPAAKDAHGRVVGSFDAQLAPVVLSRLWRLRTTGVLVVEHADGHARLDLVRGGVVGLSWRHRGADGVPSLSRPSRGLDAALRAALAEDRPLFRAMTLDLRRAWVGELVAALTARPGSGYALEPEPLRASDARDVAPLPLVHVALELVRHVPLQRLAHEARGVVGSRLMLAPALVAELPALPLSIDQQQLLRDVSEGAALVERALLDAHEELALVVVGLASGLLIGDRGARARR
jgi:hypothetical protein